MLSLSLVLAASQLVRILSDHETFKAFSFRPSLLTTKCVWREIGSEPLARRAPLPFVVDMFAVEVFWRMPPSLGFEGAAAEEEGEEEEGLAADSVPEEEEDSALLPPLKRSLRPSASSCGRVTERGAMLL